MSTAVPPPPTPDQVPDDRPPPPPAGPRRYDLDGLRAVAMFLGVVLHAAIPFVPYWEEGDPGGSLLFALFEYIHTWRMPLFFLLSGYFTTMLWRRRGLRALLHHRLRRIGLPLLLGVVTILPLVIAGFIAGYVIAGVEDGDGDGISAADRYEDPNDAPDGIGSGAGENGTEEKEADETAFAFAHLWFLWHLLWLVAAFWLVVVMMAGVRRVLGREPPGSVGLAIGWLLVALSLPFFFSFDEPVIGPDTSDSFIPAFDVLGFYACFFAFGALRYRTPADGGPAAGTADRTLDRPVDPALPVDRLGRWWPLQLPASIVLFWLLLDERIPDAWTDHVEVALAWVVSFGAIGLFRTHVSEPSFRARWYSDGAYWMYLIHLPLVFVFQGVARRLGLPAIPGFLSILAVVSVLLDLSYRYLVRYRLVGTLLNGPRTPELDAFQKQRLSA